MRPPRLSVVAALALAGVIVVAGEARAEPFDNFSRFCMGSKGDVEVAEQTLENAGWRIDERSAFLGTMTLWRSAEDIDAPNSNTENAVLLGRNVRDGVPLEVCSVVTPATRAEATERVAAMVGFTVEPEGDGSPVWVFTRGADDAVVPLPDLVDPQPEQLLEAAREHGSVHSVLVRPSRTGPTLLYMRIKP